MRTRTSCRWVVLLAACAAGPASAQVAGPSAADKATACGFVKLLQQKHLLKRDLDGAASATAVDQFAKALDPRKQYFLKEDVESFNRRKADFADELKAGDVTLAFDMVRTYQSRVAKAEKVWQELLTAADFDFTTSEAVVLDPASLEYPKDAAARRERWRLALTGSCAGNESLWSLGPLTCHEQTTRNR